MFTIRFRGAFDTVTGSRTLIDRGNQTFLVDCGLFQGASPLREKNRKQIDARSRDLSAVFLTHAHLDHSGFIPRLIKDGFAGPVYCTRGTRELSRLILMDAGYLEEEAAAFANATRYSRHNPAIPLFTYEDAKEAMKSFHIRNRREWYTFGDHLSYRFLRAGHIIGASMVQFQLMVGQKSRLVTFSGDIGHNRSFTMKGPVQLTETDILILESTYGDRLHAGDQILDELAAIVNRVVDRRGVLLIPSFAVGRAQDLIYIFRLLKDRRMIPDVPITLDSPMATEATKIFLSFDRDQKVSTAFMSDPGFLPPRFRTTGSRAESEALCREEGPAIIISSSGMLSGGRILHHLKERLPDPRNLVLFTGYQASGTKGRWLQENADQGSLRIHKKEVPVRAEVETLEGLSAHGDYQDLLEWLAGLRRPPKLILLNHGPPSSQQALAERIRERFGYPVGLSCEQQEWDLEKVLGGPAKGKAAKN